MFSKEEIKNVQEIFQEELELKVSEEEATKYAEQLVNLLLSVYKDN